MKITFLVVGKTEADYLRKGIDVYVKRLQHYLPFELLELAAIRNSQSLSEIQQKQKEGELLCSKISLSDVVVLLDEKGKQNTSVEFAEWINKKMVAGTRNLIFIVGGPYGFSGELYKRANEKISLSPMTFSHQMVRLIFVEQLYRAMTVLKGEPYHHQ